MPDFPSVSTLANRESLFLIPCTESEILKHLHSLKDRRTAGEDGIAAGYLKSIERIIARPLCPCHCGKVNKFQTYVFS